MLKIKNSKAFIIEVLLRYTDKEELKQVSADYIINDLSELVKNIKRPLNG